MIYTRYVRNFVFYLSSPPPPLLILGVLLAVVSCTGVFTLLLLLLYNISKSWYPRYLAVYFLSKAKTFSFFHMFTTVGGVEPAERPSSPN